MAKVADDIWSDVKAEMKVQSAKAMREIKQKIKRARDRINKRMKNIAAKGLEDTPAYQTWLKEGPRFMVRGKTPAELELIYERLKGIDNLKTSSVKGTINYLQDIAQNLGMNSTNWNEVSKAASNIFRLEAKVRELLDVEEDLGAAFGYAQIWTAVTEVAQRQNVDLSSSLIDLDAMVEEVRKAILVDELPMYMSGGWGEIR